MSYSDFISLLLIFCSCNIFPAQPHKNLTKHKQNGLDTLLDNVIGEVPRKDSSKFFSQLLKNEKKIISRSETKRFTISTTKEEQGTKKSTQAIPKPEDKPAISVALSTPNVYFVNLGLKSQVENNNKQEFNPAKRFRIPQLKPKHGRILSTHTKADVKPEPLLKYDSIIYINPKKETEPINYIPDETRTPVTNNKETQLEQVGEIPKHRTKRQEDLFGKRLPLLNPISSLQTLPVQTLNPIIPAQSNMEVEDVGSRSDVSAINSNKVVAMVPVKVETPIVPQPSVAMVSQTPQVVQPEVLGISRSVLPETTLIQSSPALSTNTLRSPNVGKVLVKLGAQQNRLVTIDNLDSTLKLTPEKEQENAVIKLAQVPLSFLGSKTEHFSDAKTEISSKKINSEGDSNAIKLDQLSIKPLEVKDTKKVKLKSKKNVKGDINKEALETLQSKLTSVIAKLEEKMNKKQGKIKQLRKKESLNEIAKNKPTEKSLNFLKNRLSHVLKKFNSKPGTGQPFTIGNEWRNVLGRNGPSDVSKIKKLKTKNGKENEGNWPSIASQLLRKLNRALIKLQERREARSLGENAVMYFSFDQEKSAVRNNFDNSVEDKSGHFNDASFSDRAHTSSRAYGSCGKALILNSGNLRFTPKYLKNEPTKAITLAMWVRTNVTGYVKWFAQDSGPSREFNTHTQYPLVHKNVWTHLCGTFNSSTGITRIYVDGELKTEKVNRQQERIPSDFTPAGIGPEFGDENLIAVDEVYMFVRALNPNEVRTLYDECEFNRMILHYGFQKINESEGLVFDQSGLHNDAHLQGDARVLDSGCDKCGSCLDLNAKNNPRLTIKATHFKHRPTKAISIGAWFNLNSTSGIHSLFGVTESISKSPILNLLVTDGKLQWKGYNKDHNVVFNMATTQAVVPEGIWVHILATFDSLLGEAKIFIDGHQKALTKTAKKVPIAEDWSEVMIGGRESPVRDSGGYVDEIVLYNWELEPSEISYIMKYCPDHPKLVSFTVHVPLD